MIVRSFVAFASCVVVSGCASTALPSAGAPVLLDSRFTTPQPNAVATTVRREDRPAISPCAHRIFVDGVPALQIEKGESATLYLQPGRHVIGARIVGNSFTCEEKNDETVAEIAAGQRRVLETTQPIGWTSTIRIRVID